MLVIYKYLSFYHYPFFWLALCLILGILAGHYLHLWSLKLLLFVFCLSLARLIFTSFRVVLILFIFMLVGMFLIYSRQTAYRDTQSLNKWNEKGEVEVIGEVVLDPGSLRGNNIYLRPVRIEGETVSHGLIQLYVNEKLEQKKNGEIIVTTMKLETPSRQRNPGGFCYYTYLKREGIYSLGQIKGPVLSRGQKRYPLKNSIINCKEKLLVSLEEVLSRDSYQVMKAIMLGERENIPSDWEEYFNRAGANHLLAISGLHVGFIVLMLVFLTGKLGLSNFSRNILITLFVLLYILMTGYRASVLRAGLLSVMFLWAPYIDRRGNLLNILGLTIIINLLISPYDLFAPGFLLTYLVLLTLVNWTNIFTELFPRVIAVSLAAQLGSIPLTAYFFNQITPGGVLTNLWAIPLSGLIIGGGFLVLLLELIGLPFVFILARGLEFLLFVFHQGMYLIASLPGSSVEVATPSLVAVMISYLFIFLLPGLLEEKIIPPNRIFKQEMIKIVGIIICCLILIFNLISIFDNKLEVIVFDVGQGDSIFLQLPEGYNILIDGGDQMGYDSCAGERVILPYFRHQGIKQLDLVFISHFHADHVEGIKPVLKERKVKKLVLPIGYTENQLAKEVIAVAEQKEIEILLAGRGQFLTGEKFCFEFFHPQPGGRYSGPNDNSLVKRFTYQDFTMLFTGDLEEEGEREVLAQEIDLTSDILKVGHHGSDTSSINDFLAKVSAREAVISVGENNVHGHPSEEVLERLKQKGMRKWRTDHQGAIIIEVENEDYSIRGYI